MAGERRVTGMSVLRVLMPGVGRVHRQVVPYAQAWEAANSEALAAPGPLWVALGDSMSQGIGARSIGGGWVGQLHEHLVAEGQQVRLVNLSVSGARVADVLTDQLPRLREIEGEPDLVTVLIGANDMIFRSRREPAVAAFAELLDQLPKTAIVSVLPRRNAASIAINTLIEAAVAAGRIRVADLQGGTPRSLRGTRAADHFHPNEIGYSMIADSFARALHLPQRG